MVDKLDRLTLAFSEFSLVHAMICDGRVIDNFSIMSDMNDYLDVS